MVEIFDATRYDMISGTTELHRGTREYLARIRATGVEQSAREVPDHDVDAGGKYLANEPDAYRP